MPSMHGHSGNFLTGLCLVAMSAASVGYAPKCLAVSEDEFVELRRLHRAKQYGQAVALGVPLYQELVRKNSSDKGVQDLDAFLSASSEARGLARQGLDYAAHSADMSADHIREEVKAYYKEAQKIGVGGPLDHSGLLVRLGLHRKPDLSGLDSRSQAFLDLFCRCVLLDGDRRLSAIWEGAATSVGEETGRALADYVLAYMLLTRGDQEVIQDLELLPACFTTPAQLVEFASFAVQLMRTNGAAGLYEVAAHKETNARAAIASLMRRAEILVKLKGVEHAIEAYRGIVEKYQHVPSSADAQMEIISLLAFQWKRYDAALRECRYLIELFPGTPQAVKAKFTMGQLRYLAEDYDNAVSVLEALMKEHADTRDVADVKLLLGLAHLGRRDYGEALRLFDTIIRGHATARSVAPALFFSGYVYLTQKDYAKALAACRELLCRFPKSDYTTGTERCIELLEAIGKSS